MRFWAKIGVGVLVIGMMISHVFMAKPALVAPNIPGADTASTLAAWTADNKNKSGNKGRQGKSGSTKGKPKARTKDAGQKARTDTIDKYWA